MEKEINQKLKGSYIYIATGFSVVAKKIIAFWIFFTFLSSEFHYIGITEDIVLFLSCVFAPWLYLYQQLSRISAKRAYQRVAGGIFLFSVVSSILLVFIGMIVLYIKSEENLIYLFSFLIIYSISIPISSSNSLKNLILVSEGDYKRIALIQVLTSFVAIILYLIIVNYDVDNKLNYISLAFVFSEYVGNFLYSMSISEGFLLPKKNYKLTNTLKNCYGVLVSEFTNLIFITGSSFVISVSIFYTSSESFSLFKVAFGFMACMWFVISTINPLIVMHVKKPEYKKDYIDIFVFFIKRSYFIPLALVAISLLLYYKSNLDMLKIIFFSLSFYPVMMATVMFNAILRMKNKNKLLKNINLSLFFLYFFPSSLAVIYFNLEAYVLIGVIGFSYIVRTIVTIYLIRE